VKRVLFVDDEPNVLESLRDALRPRRREWQMVFASSGEAALEALAEHPYDVVVSDMRMPGMDGAEVLSRVRELQPNSVRIILSGYAEAESVARAAPVAHRFIAKPCDTQELARVVERSCALIDLTSGEELRRTATGVASLPVVPRLYTELTTLLSQPEAGLSEAAAIVEQDVAMAGKVLQLANSAYFGRPRQISRVADAVVYLGIETLRTMTLSVEALRAFEPAQPIPGFSIDEVQRHGALVGRVARELLPEGRERDEAFAAALLHDIGLLVLACQEPEYLTDVLVRAQRENRLPVEIEYERRGISHAEVGAHLLALWGLPHGVVEAVAFHHRPLQLADPVLDPSAAVHIADALVAELVSGEGSGVSASTLDSDFVDRLRAADQVDEWRALAARYVAAN
jgi:HD-like signal output (HDOD) protein